MMQPAMVICRMCNHYAKNSEVIEMAVKRITSLKISGQLPGFQEHTYPKTLAPVVIETKEGRALEIFRWGIQVQIKGTTKPLTKYVTNARDDKLSSFPWRFAVKERRCLIPATRYFEPDGPVGRKWEVQYTLKDQPMFFVAGLWDTDPDGLTRSFTMVTTSPNELAAKLHDRMPLVLRDEDCEAWLGSAPITAERLAELCRPFPADRMQSMALPPPQKPIKKADLADSQGELLLE